MKWKPPLLVGKLVWKKTRLRRNTAAASKRRAVWKKKVLLLKRLSVKRRVKRPSFLQIRKKSHGRKKSVQWRVLTTGILRRNPGTMFALVDVANLSSDTVDSIAIQVFDWSNGSAVPLAVQPCNTEVCKVSLSPRSSDFLFADVSGVEFKYEVRIKLPRHANVLVNVTGVSGEPFTPQVGDNVLQHNLVEIQE